MIARYGAGSRWLNERHPGVAPHWPLFGGLAGSARDVGRHLLRGRVEPPPSARSTASAWSPTRRLPGEQRLRADMAPRTPGRGSRRTCPRGVAADQ